MQHRYWIGGLSMALFAWSLVFSHPVSVFAQDSPEGSMGMHGKMDKMGKEKGPGMRGDMHKRHAQMEAMHTEQLQELQQQLSALRAHTTALDSITDQQQLLTEMKKHQHMTDTLLDTMVEERKKMHVHMQARHKRMQSQMGESPQTEEGASGEHEVHPEGE
jgi:TolA-binding protein